ncbi:hypothetical protein [Demequina soli]|uniref:hypothetical protein n=1 Tax=Demequina soli TaxID=1638987 RepID=UPI0007831C7C|nr:hypothetical protein [Demequina soli]
MNRWARTLDATTRAHGAALLAYATVLTGDERAAAAMVEDALVATFGSGRAPETPDDALAAVRRRVQRAAVRRTQAGWDAEPADASSTGEALRTLTARERALLVMRYRDGLAVPAIAAAAGLHERAVREGLESAVERIVAARPEAGLSVEDALAGGLLETSDVEVGP